LRTLANLNEPSKSANPLVAIRRPRIARVTIIVCAVSKTEAKTNPGTKAAPEAPATKAPSSKASASKATTETTSAEAATETASSKATTETASAEAAAVETTSAASEC
jgi:hypothetical protein